MRLPIPKKLELVKELLNLNLLNIEDNQEMQIFETEAFKIRSHYEGGNCRYVNIEIKLLKYRFYFNVDTKQQNSWRTIPKTRKCKHNNLYVWVD